MREIVLPELVAELDDALILVVTSSGDGLMGLFERIYRKEEIDYRVKWELIKKDDKNYLIGLLVLWDSEKDPVTIGFSQELWNFLSIIRQKGQLILMVDWRILEEGLTFEGEIMDTILPKAMVINDAETGMDFLLKQVIDEVLSSEPQEKLYELLDILRPAAAPNFLN
ncbi:hypothetical protein Dtox_2375 [Desulfofarcimen acetoxidans DSM 771]|jgi:hypothetical protein|uniref:Uncharacterized protein n=1 Tax=Desulfofarcimen acetoxidans (strain ATCC 49208 / DSM 771 / KCTC 5769 / VKM B-1644 / 5575) TaxID=485916 RepID=C8W0D1_DESAS|nr:hypothetical protein [Desulfofarcimen acetoxidans]ACV63186.1 hypothetical protein Dtox_2375 [Desulfofarcimen acetoxidans DSM 771]